MLKVKLYRFIQDKCLHFSRMVMHIKRSVRLWIFHLDITLRLFIIGLFVLSSLSLLSQAKTPKELADQAFDAGNYEKSEEIWKQVAEEKAKEKDIKGEIDALLNIVRSGMHISKYETSEQYAKLAAKKAKNNNLTIKYGEVMNTLSTIYEFKDQSDSVLFACQEVINTPGLSYRLYSESYSSISNIQRNKGDIEKQEMYLMKAIELDRMNNDSSSLPFNLVNLGEIKIINNRHNEALELYFEALSFTRPGKDRFKLASIYSYISSLFRNLQNYDKSEEYGEKALAICEELNLSFTKIRAFNELAATARKQKQFEKALKYYVQSDSIFSERGGRMSFQLNVKIAMGQCLVALQKFESVRSIIDEIREAVDANEGNKEKLDFAILEAEYTLNTDPSSALQKIVKAELFNAKLKNRYVRNKIYMLYAQYYKYQDDYQKSMFYADKADALKDSIYRSDQAYIVYNLEALYQKKEQESAITLLATQNELQTAQLKAQKIIIFSSVVGLLIFGALVFFIASLLKKVRTQKQTVEASLEEKEVLLKEIHHRVKNNLQVISSLLALQSKYITDEGALGALKQGQDRVFSMALIHQILYEGENLLGVVTTSYFEQLLDNLTYSYDVEDKVAIVLEIEEMKLDVDTMIPMGLIVNELVVNSFKHAFHENTRPPQIQISLYQENKNLVLEVKDNGESLSSTNEIEGKSFGFELIKAFAKKIHATIDLEVNEGLSVKLHITKFKVL